MSENKYESRKSQAGKGQEPQSPEKYRNGLDSVSQKNKNAREDKRNMIKKVIKEKLFLSNINDLVLCDVDYNYGLFGCINDDQEMIFPGISCAPGLTANAHKDENQLLIGQALKSFGESSNMQDVILSNGPLSFLAGMSHDNDSGNYGYNLLGYCGIKNRNDMTDYQRRLSDYFEEIRENDPNHFKGQTKIRFSDLFRFRGLLGQGSYGVVMIVQDKMHHQLQKLKQGGSSLAIQNQDSFNQELLKKGNQEETYALKVINKSVLHPKEINALKTESGILRDLVGLCNVVQFMNIFETQKYIIIQMEHLKGMQMKREMRHRTLQARQRNTKAEELDSDSEHNYDDKNNSPNKLNEKKGKDKNNNQEESFDQQSMQQEQAQLMFRFGQPLKFWKHQLSFKENEQVTFGKALYTEEEAAMIMKGIMNGLHNIHEKGYIHRDLKPENIQLAPKDTSIDEEVKIIDFGLSAKQKYGVKDNHEEKIGTVLYMAPEQISSKSYSKKIDIYSVGIILYWMLVGHHPLYIQGPIFPDSSLTLKMKVASIGPHDWVYPNYVTPLAKDFICKLCQTSQVERYDTKRAIQHPWLTRRFNDKIPLTAKEETMRDELEQNLHRSIGSVLFLSIIKKKQIIDDVGSPTTLTLQPNDRRHSSSNCHSAIDHFLNFSKSKKHPSVASQGKPNVSMPDIQKVQIKLQSILNTGIKQFMALKDDEHGRAIKARMDILGEQYGISKQYLEKMIRAMDDDNQGNQGSEANSQSNRKSSNNVPSYRQSGGKSPKFKNRQAQWAPDSFSKNINKNGSREQKQFSYKKHHLSYGSPEKQNSIAANIDSNSKMCETPDFLNDEANQMTIGNDSVKMQTDHRRSEFKKGGSSGQDVLGQNSFSHQITINHNKNGGHRNSTKKQVKLSHVSANNTSSKKNKHSQNNDNVAHGSQSAQKPKQMQFEYGEGMANIINGLGSYKNHLSNLTNNISSSKNLTEEQKREERPSPSTKGKDQSKKPGRKIVGPVPFIVDEDSIRITENSVIGNGLVQMGSNPGQTAYARGSKGEKIQNEQKINSSNCLASNQNQQGFIQVRPIFQAQSLTTKGSPLKNFSSSPNKAQRSPNPKKGRFLPLNPIEGSPASDIDQQNPLKQTTIPSSGDHLKFKIELKQSCAVTQQDNQFCQNPHQPVNDNRQQSINRTFNVKNIRDGPSGSQMVMKGSSNRNFRGTQIGPINSRGLQVENPSMGKSNESHAFTPVQYGGDMSQSLSRMSSRETHNNEFNRTRDGRLPSNKQRHSNANCPDADMSGTYSGSANTKSQSIAIAQNGMIPQGSLSSTKNSLRYNYELNPIAPMISSSNGSQMDKRYPFIPASHYHTSQFSYQDPSESVGGDLSVNYRQMSSGMPQIRTGGPVGASNPCQNMLPIQQQTLNMRNNFQQNSHILPRKVSENTSYQIQPNQQQLPLQKTPVIPSTKASLISMQNSQTKPQKSQQFFGRLAGALLVPQPAGEQTNSQYEKKEMYDLMHEEKQKDLMGSLPHYEIPLKNGPKRQFEFAETFNLRKQHTTAGVSNHGKHDLVLSKKNSLRKNEARLAANKHVDVNVKTQNIYSLPAKSSELADHQVISDFNDSPSYVDSDVIISGPSSRFHNTTQKTKTSKYLNNLSIRHVSNSNRHSQHFTQDPETTIVGKRPPSVTSVNPTAGVTSDQQQNAHPFSHCTTFTSGQRQIIKSDSTAPSLDDKCC